MAKVKIIKNKRDPPLFTGKLLIKFQNILRNTTQVIVRHRICLQTDGQTDGHGETSIPPYNFVAVGIKTCKTKLSLQLFLMANFDRVNGPIDMRVWKERRFENILKLDRDLR
jgi:hypothetical protein